MADTNGLFVLGGLLFGAVEGVLLGELIQNPVLGVALGALGGAVLGLVTAWMVRDHSRLD